MTTAACPAICASIKAVAAIVLAVASGVGAVGIATPGRADPGDWQPTLFLAYSPSTQYSGISYNTDQEALDACAYWAGPDIPNEPKPRQDAQDCKVVVNAQGVCGVVMALPDQPYPAPASKWAVGVASTRWAAEDAARRNIGGLHLNAKVVASGCASDNPNAQPWTLPPPPPPPPPGAIANLPPGSNTRAGQ